jgi:ribosomal protein L28
MQQKWFYSPILGHWFRVRCNAKELRTIDKVSRLCVSLLCALTTHIRLVWWH